MGIQIIRAERGDAPEFCRLEAECFEMDANDGDTLYYRVPMLEHQCCFKAVDGGSRMV